MQNKKRIIAISVLICFIFTLLFSSAVVAIEGGHDCFVEQCPVCRAIETAQNLIDNISDAGKEKTCAPPMESADVVLITAVIACVVTITLVTLKVKLTD